MEQSLVTFFRVLPGLAPRRALSSAVGTLPSKAHQYCEPARLASAFGYYVFLPLTFQVEWDGGREALWSFDEGVTWYPLATAAYPNSMAAWDLAAPDSCKGFCPAFLALSEDGGMLQIWTGWFARTAPGYSLLVRQPANVAPSAGYYHFEGIIETDRWFGPLFVNIRLTRSEAPIRFERTFPFLQVQPIPRAAYSDKHLNYYAVEEAIPAELYGAYEASLISTRGQHGHYAKTVRRRSRED